MKSPERAVAMQTVVRGALFVLLLICPTTQTPTPCGKHKVKHIITNTEKGCNPMLLHSLGCRGTCFSYSRVSPRDYGVIERSCQCCQEAGYRTALVKLTCPRHNPPFDFVMVKLATDCKCRPCNMIRNVPDLVTLNDYLTN